MWKTVTKWCRSVHCRFDLYVNRGGKGGRTRRICCYVACEMTPAGGSALMVENTKYN